MIVGFTGTRNGMSKSQKKVFKETVIFLMRKELVTEFHHGDCMGSDDTADTIIKDHFPTIKVVVHPPKESKFRAFCLGSLIKPPKEYLDRNKDIVNESDILIAAPKEQEEVMRSGTWSTIRYAKKQSKPVIILLPVEKEKS
jgi:hypothetical protein